MINEKLKQLLKRKKLREDRVKGHTRHSKKGLAFNVRDYVRRGDMEMKGRLNQSAFDRLANDYAQQNQIGVGNTWYKPDEVSPGAKAYRKAALARSVHNVRVGVIKRSGLKKRKKPR